MSLSFSIESPQPGDALAIRLLVPSVDALLDEPTVFVATIANPRRVVGVGAVWTVTVRTRPTTVPCAIHVALPWRQHGIGSALLQAMGVAASDWGAAALCSRGLVKRGSPEHQGWHWLGFSDSAVLRSYTADATAPAKQHMELYEWCVSTGRMPASARTFRPGPEHAAAIARLNAEGLGGMAWHMLEGYRAVAGTPADVSMAVADGERIVGFILTRATSPHTLHVHSHVIARSHREGWAQAMLHHEFMRWIAELGYRTLTFEAGEVHTVTRKTARRVGATLVAERTTMIRPITASSAEASAPAQTSATAE